MYYLDEDLVQGIFSTAREDLVYEFVEVYNEYAEQFGIITKVHSFFFLAQLREEVGPSLESRRENLNYSCSALKKIFRYYRNNPIEASQDGRCNNHRANQRKIANKVYENRIGNNNYNSGDGYRFRGGGFIQLTGKGNYIKMSEIISMVLQKVVTEHDIESEISTVTMGLLASLAFWMDKRMWECDHIDCVTRRVNRYTDSYNKRKQHYLYIAGL
ncbi:MAG: hypothetical protein J7L15_03230 [Clostridiales bacterium]|nr:hypothetical protein [Clostridiales bacterium]